MATDVIRPQALRPGDTVRIVSPSGPVSRKKTKAGIALLESWGLQVDVPDRAYDSLAYLGGEDEVRVAQLNEALADPDIRGVICSRGGYGASRIVDDIDTDAAAADPKPVVGYSDITAVLNALYARSGITGIHGPMLSSFATDHAPCTAESIHKALMSPHPIVIAQRDGETTAPLSTSSRTVTGRLLGGNLSLMVDAVGTPSCPDYANAIVFFEEINEEPYRVDRILTQLLRSGAFENVAGFAVGQFTKCVDDDWSWDILDVLRERLSGLGVPILGGLPFGHGDDPLTVPFGTQATLDTKARTLTAQSAVR